MTDKTDALVSLADGWEEFAIGQGIAVNAAYLACAKGLREALAEQPAGAVGDGKWVLIEQCATCHGSGYKSGVNGPRQCLNCDGEGSRSPSPAASVDVEALREVAARCDAYAKHRKMTAYWRPAFVSLHRMLVTLIDSAGGPSASVDVERLRRLFNRINRRLEETNLPVGYALARSWESDLHRLLIDSAGGAKENNNGA